MAEYDPTNSGVIFSAFDDQKLAGQGKINIEGQEFRCALISEPLTKGGAPELVLYMRLAPLFRNDKGDNEKSPDRSGPMDPFPGKRVAAWLKEKDGRKYFSLAVSERQERAASSDNDVLSGNPVPPINDDIPF